MNQEIVEGGDIVMAMRRGWRTFLAENKIKVGDFLIFEVDDKANQFESTLNLTFDVVRYMYFFWGF